MTKLVAGPGQTLTKECQGPKPCLAVFGVLYECACARAAARAGGGCVPITTLLCSACETPSDQQAARSPGAPSAPCPRPAA